jgi:hypothetical protein
MAGEDLDDPWSDPLEAASQGGKVRGLVGPAQEDRVGTPQSGHRLPQASPREQPAATEWVGCVHHDEVQVAVQLPVLEAVIQQQEVRAEQAQGFPAGQESVAAHHHGHPGQPPREEDGFVTHRFPAGTNPPGIGRHGHA